jgi:hypothetical protein
VSRWITAYPKHASALVPNIFKVTPFLAFSGMMWNVWGLIIVGGVWDAVTSITLRNAEDDRCVGVVGETVRMSSGRAGYAGQSWLWEGKRLKKELTVQYIGVPTGDVHSMWMCGDSGYSKGYDEATEFARWGEHGLKTSKGKCLKLPRGEKDAMKAEEPDGRLVCTCWDVKRRRIIGCSNVALGR